MKFVTFGEIMLRLTPPGFQRFVQARSFDVVYGGGEANVAASLANYGLPVEYVTRLPANDIGDACLSYLRQYGIGTRHVVCGGARLGIYFLEMGAAQRGSKVIYDRAGSSLATIQPGMIDWQTVLDGAAQETEAETRFSLVLGRKARLGDWLVQLGIPRYHVALRVRVTALDAG